jgi:Ca2+-binding EF-hand superfamily protein
MALTSAYLVTTKNLESFLNALRSAKAPERFTNKFLSQLDFSSSNDRLFIGLLKGLGFIDESGTPTQRYYQFLDQTQSGRILADALREAYEDLFAVNTKAQEMTSEEVKNKLKTLTLGQKSDNVLGLMANTYKALVDLADWDAPAAAPAPPVSVKAAEAEEPPRPTTQVYVPPLRRDLELHYNIQIHLPESRDPAVFDAIFLALRKHLV